uniref:(northern house mosquito) hypothetical protein n=1 Tax=Culex pipiens TaxID=7175 RepID=A0A8D8JDY7_CULPI
MCGSFPVEVAAGGITRLTTTRLCLHRVVVLVVAFLGARGLQTLRSTSCLGLVGPPTLSTRELLLVVNFGTEVAIMFALTSFCNGFRPSFCGIGDCPACLIGVVFIAACLASGFIPLMFSLSSSSSRVKLSESMSVIWSMSVEWRCEIRSSFSCQQGVESSAKLECDVWP